MAETSIQRHIPARSGFWRWGLVGLAPLAGLAALSWWLTAPLEDEPAPRRRAPAADPVKSTAETPKADPSVPPPWPAVRLDGREAKSLLLTTLEAVDARLRRVDGYTATFHKQERIAGKLGPRQTLSMKVRQRPFAVYMKFLGPQTGKEVVYAEGHHDNKVIAHSTGVSRWLVPRLAVPPDHPLAMADSRHAVTEVGLLNLTGRLIKYRKMDLADRDAVTILDRVTDDDGKPWLRSIHTHQIRASDRPFARVEVLYDPETRFPLRISNFDWPARAAPEHEPLLLAERYAYDALDVDARLSTLDFDPANPAYAFRRY